MHDARRLRNGGSMDQWMELAMRVQSIAQAGLTYGGTEYDKERYEELRNIAAEMLCVGTEVPVDTVKRFFCNETGYQTPKIDTRAAGATWISRWRPTR